MPPPAESLVSLLGAAAAGAGGRGPPAARAAQRAAAAERRGLRREELLRATGQGATDALEVWRVECGEDWWSNFTGAEASPPPRQLGQCGRLVLDGLAYPAEVEVLREAMERSFDGMLHRGAEVSLVPDRSARTRLGGRGLALVEELVERCRLAVERGLLPSGGGHLRTVGSLLKRVRLPAEEGRLQAEPDHDPFVVHADRANVADYEYSALLYLSTAGSDFTGGEFVFVDADVNRIIQPAAGRLVAFTSGLENLHQAAPVQQGTRYMLGMWFGHAGATPSGPGVGAAELAAPILAIVAIVGLALELAKALWSLLPGHQRGFPSRSSQAYTPACSTTLPPSASALHHRGAASMGSAR